MKRTKDEVVKYMQLQEEFAKKYPNRNTNAMIGMFGEPIKIRKKGKNGSTFEYTKHILFDNPYALNVKMRGIQMDDKPRCPHCGKEAVIVTKKELTNGKEEDETAYWVCPTNPEYYATTLPDSPYPQAYLADNETRRYRWELHKILNQSKGLIPFHKTNEYISKILDLDPEESFVGRLSPEELKKVARFHQLKLFNTFHSGLFKEKEKNNES